VGQAHLVLKVHREILALRGLKVIQEALGHKVLRGYKEVMGLTGSMESRGTLVLKGLGEQ